MLQADSYWLEQAPEIDWDFSGQQTQVAQVVSEAEGPQAQVQEQDVL